MKPSASTVSSASRPRAGFFVRLAAYFIDLAAIGLTTAATRPLLRDALSGAKRYLSQILIGSAGAGASAQAEQLRGLSEIVVTVSLVTALYFLIEGLSGRALGKLVLGLRVARTNGSGDGGRALRGAWLSRYLIKNAGALLLLVGLSAHAYGVYRTGEILVQVTLVGFLVVLHGRRQALHDLITDTAVFRAPREARTALQAG